jgi:hypothetical protein
MKTFLMTTAIAIAVVFSAPAFAQFGGGGGNIHGEDSRGEPFNSTYRASGVDPATGYTIGHTGLRPGLRGYARGPAYAKAPVKKKRPHVTTTGSATVGY